MKFAQISKHKHFRPVMGAVLAVLCGLALWKMPAGEPWVHASYDYLFCFGMRPATNQFVLVQMDNDSYGNLRQTRGAWNRALHMKMVDKLTEAGCPLVVFDVMFEKEVNVETDEMFAKAIQRNGRVVLATRLGNPKHPGSEIREVIPLDKRFDQASTNKGIGGLLEPEGTIVRHHYPFPAPDDTFTCVPWTAARLSGANLPESPTEQWIRYYAWSTNQQVISYYFALEKPAAFFRDKVVFIGNEPEQADVGIYEKDKYLMPSSRWASRPVGVGGVQFLITEYLNLIRGDWLRRTAPWLELLLIGVSGIAVGGGFGLLRPLRASFFAVGAFLLIGLVSVLGSYYTNYWYPWLVIAGGQVPCALAWAIVSRRFQPVAAAVAAPAAGRKKTVVLSPDMFGDGSEFPDAPDYEFFGEAFGEGTFGKVWVVRNSVGQLQALKAVYAAKFGKNAKPYEMEFKGITRFKPISGESPGLLRVDFVSKQKPEGYFYYVMELGDAAVPGWEKAPTTYRPRDLFSATQQNPDNRLPVPQCIDIGASLADALDFLHEQGFVHRDIKPSNIIFVKGRPKLADVGLVTDIRPENEFTSFAGTEHYMPPAPELPGTPQADIYALGKVLYVISTGNHPRQFPELPPALLAETADAMPFMRLNPILLKACASDRNQRFTSAAELREALKAIQRPEPGPRKGIGALSLDVKEKRPEAEDYEFFGESFGAGTFGKVWIVRNAVGQYQALKAIYAANFGKERKPFEMELNGVKRYKPISSDHPGLLRVDFVSRIKDEGYFYYVMELGDAAEPDWEKNPAAYCPRDLHATVQMRPTKRLTLAECLPMGIALAEALEFLHQKGFVHRDIKPRNIIFVNGQPKLADVGLTMDIRPEDEITSYPGTRDYMPPAPEMPGTPQADIYALGKVLYVVTTGSHPLQCPALPRDLLDPLRPHEMLLRFKSVLEKACEPDRQRRYASARDLRKALEEIQLAMIADGGTARM